MSGRARLALCATAATLLTTCSLLPLTTPMGWFGGTALLIGVQAGVGAATRRIPLARPVTVLAQAAGDPAAADGGLRLPAGGAGLPARTAGGGPAGAAAVPGGAGRRAVRDPGAGDPGDPAAAGRRGGAGRADGRRAGGDVRPGGAGRTAAAGAVLGGLRAGDRRGPLAVVPARRLRLPVAAAGRGPGSALAVGAGLQRHAAPHRIRRAARPGGGPAGGGGAQRPADRGDGAGHRPVGARTPAVDGRRAAGPGRQRFRAAAGAAAPSPPSTRWSRCATASTSRTTARCCATARPRTTPPTCTCGS